jgi:hypothetical protein
MLESLTVERIDWENWKARQRDKKRSASVEEASKEELEFIPAEEVRQKLCMSPSQFINMLNNRKGPRLVTSMEESFIWENRYFATPMINELSIHRLDLQKYLSERQAEAESVPDASTLKAQLAEVQAERGRLSEALEKANARIAELEVPNPELEPAPRTQLASDAKMEKDLNSWKTAFGAMIKVATRCVEEEKKQLPRADLKKMFQAELATITTAQMDFFREAMPDEYINRVGGNSWKK